MGSGASVGAGASVLSGASVTSVVSALSPAHAARNSPTTMTSANRGFSDIVDLLQGRYPVRVRTEWEYPQCMQHAPPGCRRQQGFAEGVGFEPTRRRQPPTAFRVPRTRPDYATPPGPGTARLFGVIGCRPQVSGSSLTYHLRLAEGEGFEPSRGRKPPTAFPVPRTRPDYAIPPGEPA